MIPSNPQLSRSYLSFPLAAALPRALQKLLTRLLAAFLLLASLWLCAAPAAAQQSNAPGVPTDFAASRGNTHRQAFLAWRPPASDGGSAITHYVISYAENAGFSENEETVQVDAEAGNSGRQTHRIGSLTRGTRYYFRIAAVNANGQSSWSETADAMPLPVVTVVAVNDSITEGAEAQFRVNLRPAPSSNTSMTVEISVEGNYVTDTNDRSVTVNAGQKNEILSIATTDDTTDEPDGSIVARVRGVGDYAVGNPRTATISVTDNDVNEAPTVTGNAAPTYPENGTEAVATYTVSDYNTEDTHTWSREGTDAAAFSISTAAC